MTHLVSICSSPVKGGNSEFLTRHMEEAARELGCHHSSSPLGASAVSSRHGEGLFNPEEKRGVAEDREGLASGRLLVERAVTLARRLDRGAE